MAEDNPAAREAGAREGETFSREYVSELRNENKSWRLKVQEHEQARLAAEEAAAATAREIAAKADERVIRAELRTLAIRAGMVDLDGLKLADLTHVRLNEDGEVEGAEALMAHLREAKPYLFAAPSLGASNPAPRPPPRPAERKRATEMTDAEYDAAMRRIDAGRGGG